MDFSHEIDPEFKSLRSENGNHFLNYLNLFIRMKVRKKNLKKIKFKKSHQPKNIFH